MADDNYGSDNTNDPTIDFGDEFGVVRFGSGGGPMPGLFPNYSTNIEKRAIQCDVSSSKNTCTRPGVPDALVAD